MAARFDLWPQRLAAFHQQHRRAIHGSVVVGLIGFSAVAFGVAPLAPDAADLPQQVIIEDLPLTGLDTQLEALAELDLELTRADLTRGNDTAESLLSRLGVVDADAAAFLRRDPTARRVLQGRPGKMVQVGTGEGGRLTSLVARYPAENAEQALSHFTRLSIERVAEQWQARVETAPLASQVRLGSGTIRSSLFAAADEARIPDGISIQMAEIFSNEIDFHRELRVGDTFSVVYEALTADGDPITWNDGTGRVLAAEFVNAGKAYEAVWFAGGPGTRGGYFALDGTSKQRSFLSSPMAFSRVTSGFAMRFHPIMKSWRAHKGIDYGAPKGTPIRAVGCGHRGVRRLAERLWQRRRGAARQRQEHLLRPHEPHRRAQGPARRTGPARRRRRLHRLVHRPAPALRVPRQRRPPGPAQAAALGRDGGAGGPACGRSSRSRPKA